MPVVEGVLQSTSSGAAQYSISATGSLVYVPAAVQSAPLRLVWVSRNGTEQQLAADAHAYVQPRLSPDGRRMTVGIAEKEGQVWLYDRMSRRERLMYSVGIGPPEEKSELCSLDRISWRKRSE